MKRVSTLVLLVLLVLEAWTAWARPSEAMGAVLGPGIKLLDKETILHGCPCCRPATFNSPQEIKGPWCGLINSYENRTYPDPDCTHTTVIGDDSDHLQTVEEHFLNGRIHETRSENYTKIENGSWLTTTGNLVMNIFFGLSADGKMMLMCGTVSPRGVVPTEVYGIAQARCLRLPGDREQAEAGLRPMVQVCEELPASTPASA